ncbi:hypothetical protein BH24CHL6_BH24CHL6_10970 [soil metagenome]
MRRDVIATCPVCEGDLQVTRLNCSTCGTGIEGHFNVGRFARLNREQAALLESFLRARGNLRELERELGISYPTVRNRVEALVRTLGLSDGGAPLPQPEARSPATPMGAQRRQILEKLAKHELTAEEAAAALRGEPSAEIDDDTDTQEEDK